MNSRTTHSRHQKHRSIFITEPEDQQVVEPPKQTKKQRRSAIYLQDSEPIINNQNDSIYLNTNNYNPNQSLIDVLGFKDIQTFVQQSNNPGQTMNNLKDNSFNDFNETGDNNINNSDYRQRMIRQMMADTIQQTESMFGKSEKLNKNNVNRENPNMPEYSMDSSYTPSKAPSKYLQQQSKRIFRDNNFD